MFMSCNSAPVLSLWQVVRNWKPGTLSVASPTKKKTKSLTVFRGVMIVRG